MSTLTIHSINFASSDYYDHSGDAILFNVDGLWGMIDAGGAASTTKRQNLINAGATSCTPEQIGDTNDVISYMQSQGITQLEWFIQTHFHYDHAWVSDKVIRTFNPKVVYAVDPTAVAGYTLPSVEGTTRPDNYWDTYTFLNRFKQAIADMGTNWIVPGEGGIVMLGDAQFKIINTDGINNAAALSDYNTASLAVYLTHGNLKFLFCGDATYHTMNAHAQNIGEVDFVQVSHHGWIKNTSTDMAFALKPTIAAASKWAGWDNYQQICMGLYQLQGSQLHHLDASCVAPFIWQSDGTSIVALHDTSLTKYTIKNEWVDATNSMKRWYYFDANGNRQTNWLEISGAWYYFCPVSSQYDYYNRNAFYLGQMMFGHWIQASGGTNWYWVMSGDSFDGTSASDQGKMAVSRTLTINGKAYQFDASGVCLNP